MFRPHSARGRLLLTARLLSIAIFVLPAFLGVAAQPVALAAPARQAAPPDVTAPEAIVVEYPSGKVLYAKNIHKRVPEASTTKTMTALLVLQRVALTDVVTATADDLVGESTMGLQEGEQQTVLNLLYGLMLPSGNDAAMVLARHVGSSLTEPADAGPVARFVALMNEQAAQMGLADTHFMNPHGFDDPNHYSSAYDLASITWYDLHNPTFNQVVDTSFKDVPGHSLQNTNELLTRYPGADGVKTGWTDIAGNCLVASATRNGRRLVAVVLGEPHGYTWDDTSALLDYGFSQDGSAATDTLTIARRSELLWWLADAVPTPLPTPRATATLVPTATPVPQGFTLPNFLAAAPAAPAARAQIAAASTAPAAPGGGGPGVWLWPLLAVPLGAGILFLTWGRGRGRRLTPAPAAAPAAAPRITLLNANDARTRAERAIALAYRGQEGSSLAEFLLVVKENPEFEFGKIAGFYDMPAAGYLALARAYVEHARPRYASALLRLGQETYPEDRALGRLLAEIEPPAPDAPPAPAAE